MIGLDVFAPDGRRAANVLRMGFAWPQWASMDLPANGNRRRSTLTERIDAARASIIEHKGEIS